MTIKRDAGIQVLGLSFDFLGLVYPQYTHINCHWWLSTCMTIQDYPIIHVLAMRVYKIIEMIGEFLKSNKILEDPMKF